MAGRAYDVEVMMSSLLERVRRLRTGTRDFVQNVAAMRALVRESALRAMPPTDVREGASTARRNRTKRAR